MSFSSVDLLFHEMKLINPFHATDLLISTENIRKSLVFWGYISWVKITTFEHLHFLWIFPFFGYELFTICLQCLKRNILDILLDICWWCISVGKQRFVWSPDILCTFILRHQKRYKTLTTFLAEICVLFNRLCPFLSILEKFTIRALWLILSLYKIE